MEKVTTKHGNTYYVTFTDDCDNNVGGYYCQVYLDENLEEEIGFFVLHKRHIDEYGIDNLVQDYVEDFDCEFNNCGGTGNVTISICSNNVDVELYGDDDDCKEIAKLLNVNGNLYINDKLSN
jgi:hypothetical protein